LCIPGALRYAIVASMASLTGEGGKQAARRITYETRLSRRLLPQPARHPWHQRADSMGTLKHVHSASMAILSRETTVGRSAHCGLLLQDRVVSALHACIRWSVTGWEIRDLGSTNGTYLNGNRLRAAETRLIATGDAIAFGTLENRYEVVETGPPMLTAVSDDGEMVRADGPLLVLPSTESPLITIYRDADGAWQIEGSAAAATATLGDGSTFQALGRTWRLMVPEGVTRTQGAEGIDVRHSAIHFLVSPDEERVQIVVRGRGQEVSIASRASNYMLLTLARHRLCDLEAGITEDEAGWVLLEDLARALATTPEHINVDVYRVRKRLGAIFCNAAEIIERRTGTGQLRIGIRDMQVQRTPTTSCSVASSKLAR
jgi:hypothetical protein